MGKYDKAKHRPLATMVDPATEQAVDMAIQAKGLANRSEAVKEAIAYWLAHLDLLPRSVAARMLGRKGKKDVSL